MTPNNFIEEGFFPKLSIIMPVYNAVSYLDRAVDSVLAQTFRDYELILVDDGSTDDSGDLCDEFAKKDSRIRVIHQENRGISGAKATGVQAARCEYVGFMDNDDYILPIRYERMYQAIIESNADMVCAGCVKIPYDNLPSQLPLCEDELEASWQRDWIKRGYPENEVLDTLSFMRLYFEEVRFKPLWQALVRKSIIKPCFFKAGLSRSEDIFFFLNLFKSCPELRVRMIPDHSYIYILRNVSTRNDPKFYNDSFYVVCQMLRFFEENDFTKWYNSSFVSLVRHCVFADLDLSKKGSLDTEIRDEALRLLRKNRALCLRNNNLSATVKLGFVALCLSPGFYYHFYRVYHRLRYRREFDKATT